MKNVFAHGVEDGFGALKIGGLAADHKGERSRSCSGYAAGDWCVQSAKALVASLVHGASRFIYRDGGAVDEQGVFARTGKHATIIKIYRVHMLTRRQHSDDEGRVCHAVGGICGGYGASGHGVRNRLRVQVEGAYTMTSGGEVRAHAAAHVAKSNECDIAHDVPLKLFLHVARRRCYHSAMLPSGCRQMGLRQR